MADTRYEEHYGGNGAGRPRTPDELERELETTRREMDDTVAAIAYKLSPEALMHQAREYFEIGPKEFATRLGDSVRYNPLPAMITGIGLAWLMWADRHPAPPRPHYTTTTGPSAGDTAHAAGEKLHAGSESARRQAEDIAGRTQAGAAGMREGVRQRAEHLRERVSDARAAGSVWAVRAQRTAGEWGDRSRNMYHEQPLVMGALGLAIGALLGAGAPITRRERETLGPHRDRMVEQASRQAEHQSEGVAQKAERGIEEAGRKASEAVHTGAAKAEEKTQEASAGGSTPKATPPAEPVPPRKPGPTGPQPGGIKH